MSNYTLEITGHLYVKNRKITTDKFLISSFISYKSPTWFIGLTEGIQVVMWFPS